MDNESGKNEKFYSDGHFDFNKKVYGVKNITSHAGSTTIIYLMMKMLQAKKKKRVLAVEVNKNDFRYFREDNMVSCSAENLIDTINASNPEIVFVDLNDYYGNYDVFTDIVYLVEPSIIKLNKLMMTDRFVFKDLNDKKVILNKSMLSNKDMSDLAKEAGVEILLNIPPLNDRVNNDFIAKLLHILDLM